VLFYALADDLLCFLPTFSMRACQYCWPSTFWRASTKTCGISRSLIASKSYAACCRSRRICFMAITLTATASRCSSARANWTSTASWRSIAWGHYTSDAEASTWFKIRNRDYSQWAGRNAAFERDRHREPKAGWHACELAAMAALGCRLTNCERRSPRIPLVSAFSEVCGP
jgi:hypothetical protein